MKLGLFQSEEWDKSFPSRRVRAPHSDHPDPVKNQSDIARLVLLSAMVLAAIFGYYINRASNIPVKIVNKSVEAALKQPFRASIEGSVTLMDSTLASFRNRQTYDPERGLRMVSAGDASGGQPFDSVETLEELARAQNVYELDKQDMYGHGTRHFSGTMPPVEDNDRIARVFDLWIDVRSFLPVRLSITQVERGADSDAEGNPVARETYMNIRFFGWR